MHTENGGGTELAETTNLLRMLLASPRTVVRQFRQRAGGVRAQMLFRGAEIGRHVEAPGRLRVVKEGRMCIGDNVIFQGGMIVSELVCHAGGELIIGANCAFNYGFVIDCRESVRIGERCLFGSMTLLRDSDMTRHGPIVIEDDVWVAHGAVIEPGVHIGAGLIVSAGSVVGATFHRIRSH